MQSVKDIKARIKSVSETAKITRAMELISASKMQKASLRYNSCRAYFDEVNEIIGDIVNGTEFAEDKLHPYLDGSRRGKKGFFVIGSDKGLAGDYNHALEAFARSVLKDEPNCVLYCAGENVYNAFKGEYETRRFSCVNGSLEEARIIGTHLAEDYKAEVINELSVVYMHLESKSRHVCSVMKLLPVLKENFEVTERTGRNEIFPDPQTAFSVIVPQYLVGILYGCITEAHYVEHLERMRAMSSATESAQELLEELRLNYNKARQERITTELTELSVTLLETE